MDQSFGIQEILSDVTLDVHFILAHMAHFTKHVASVLFPSGHLRELDSNLAQKGVRVLLNMRISDAVEHHELVLVSELGGKHPLEKLLNLTLLA